MSDEYGVFEHSASLDLQSNNGAEERQRAFFTAQDTVQIKFGSFLANSSDKKDFTERVSLVKREIISTIKEYNVQPSPGVLRKIISSMEPVYKTQEQTVRPNSTPTRVAGRVLVSKVEQGDRGYNSVRGSAVIAWVWDKQSNSYMTDIPHVLAGDSKTHLESLSFNCPKKVGSKECGNICEGQGLHRCKCGSVWNIWTIGSHKDNGVTRTKVFCREVKERPTVLASKREVDVALSKAARTLLESDEVEVSSRDNTSGVESFASLKTADDDDGSDDDGDDSDDDDDDPNQSYSSLRQASDPDNNGDNDTTVACSSCVHSGGVHRGGTDGDSTCTVPGCSCSGFTDNDVTPGSAPAGGASTTRSMPQPHTTPFEEKMAPRTSADREAQFVAGWHLASRGEDAPNTNDTDLLEGYTAYLQQVTADQGVGQNPGVIPAQPEQGMQITPSGMGVIDSPPRGEPGGPNQLIPDPNADSYNNRTTIYDGSRPPIPGIPNSRDDVAPNAPGFEDAGDNGAKANEEVTELYAERADRLNQQGQNDPRPFINTDVGFSAPKIAPTAALKTMSNEQLSVYYAQLEAYNEMQQREMQRRVNFPKG